MSKWRQTTLGEVVTLQRGHDLTEQERTPGPIPVIGSAGQNGWHNVALVDGPGVTIGRSGASAGVVTYIREAYWPHNTVLYVRDFKGNDPLFVAKLLQTLPLAELNSGAAQPSLNRNIVYLTSVLVPDVGIQRRIASVLGAYDDLIEVNRRRIARLEEMARRLFEEWFIHLRFPGHQRSAMKGGRPEGWQQLTLGELAEVRLGKMLDAAKNRGELRPYLANVNVRWGSFDLSELRSMRFEPDEAEKYSLVYGDIVMCEGGEPGRCAMWKGEAPQMMLQKALHRIRSKSNIDRNYLFHCLLFASRS